MKCLTIYYQVTAEGLHSTDDEYLFILSDDEDSKRGQISVSTDRAVAVLSKIVSHFDLEGEDLGIDCYYEGVLVASSTVESELVSQLLEPWRKQS